MRSTEKANLSCPASAEFRVGSFRPFSPALFLLLFLSLSVRPQGECPRFRGVAQTRSSHNPSAARARVYRIAVNRRLGERVYASRTTIIRPRGPRRTSAHLYRASSSHSCPSFAGSSSGISRRRTSTSGLGDHIACLFVDD